MAPREIKIHPSLKRVKPVDNIEKPEATYAENGKDCQSRRKA
jgi:hypothetical protein